jgi:hypothetical protein
MRTACRRFGVSGIAAVKVSESTPCVVGAFVMEVFVDHESFA